MYTNIVLCFYTNTNYNKVKFDLLEASNRLYCRRIASAVTWWRSHCSWLLMNLLLVWLTMSISVIPRSVDNDPTTLVWNRWIISKLLLLEQPRGWVSEVHRGLRIWLYRSTLLDINMVEFLPSSQCTFLNLIYNSSFYLLT